MRQVGTVIASALALAACSNPAPNAVPAESGGQTQGSSATRGEIDERTPRAPATATPPSPATSATPAAGVPERTPRRTGGPTFPTAYQGHWGLTTADCDLSRPDAPGLMKVRGGTLDFHDSTARARALSARDPYRIVADLDFKGGTRAWQRRETLALEMGGTRLVRGEAGGTYRYEKCS